jgi:hypothetical protein
MDCHLLLGLIIIFIVAVTLTMLSIAIKPLSQSEALFEGYYQDWLKYIKLLFKIICLFNSYCCNCYFVCCINICFCSIICK